MKRTRKRLREAGYSVVDKLGTFSVLPGTKNLELVSKSEAAVKRYITKFEKEGWRLETRPKVKLIKRWEPTYRVSPDTRGDMSIWTPTSTGMRDDHPWHIEDADQYQVTAWWSQLGKQVTFEIPDDKLTRLMEKGTLPVGVEVQ